jgi:hypothetical protein
MKAPQLTFLDFLFDDDCMNYCKFMFGEEMSSAETMLAEFRRSVDSYYFGTVRARPGRHAWKLDKPKSATKQMLQHFARQAYRGDREKRGVRYWAQVATWIWNAYAHVMAMREQGAKITRLDIEHRASLAKKRSANAARVERCRAKKRAAG